MTTDKENGNKGKTEVFEGPLPLLLKLIEKRKLLINDMSLAKVTDDFIHHVENHGGFPIADSADFILVASTLLLIKSKSLLQNLALTEEERGSIEDLENKLAIYKKYKELAGGLQKMFGNFLYFAEENKQTRVIFSPTSDINLTSLKNALQEALKNMPQKMEELPKVVVNKIISLEEMVEKLSERIRTSLKTSFKDFSGAEKIN